MASLFKDEDVLLVSSTDGAFKRNRVCSALAALCSQTVDQMFGNVGRKKKEEKWRLKSLWRAVYPFSRESFYFRSFLSPNANYVFTHFLVTYIPSHFNPFYK